VATATDTSDERALPATFFLFPFQADSAALPPAACADMVTESRKKVPRGTILFLVFSTIWPETM
jgi:hypothetical protein